MIVHNFKKSISYSESHEAKIDQWLIRKGYQVEDVPMELQEQGADRIITKDKFRRIVEYKTDFHTAKTGNIYVETIAHRATMTMDEMLIARKQKLGWIYNSIAELIFYRVVNSDIIYIFKLAELRDFYAQNKQKYETIVVKNEGFEGTGRLIPVKDLLVILKAYRFN